MATLVGVPVEAILYAVTLLVIALTQLSSLRVAVAGLSAIVAWKLAVTGFATGPGLTGLARHFEHEAPILVNLFLLLVAFALLARHVEQSGLPDAMPIVLPAGRTGAFALLAIIFVLSAVLDNIAAALIGGTIARHVFQDRVHPGYVAAIVAAANAGGAGSVIGDTTTTMMWISGISPLSVAPAYIASGVALLVSGIPAAYQQHKLSPVMRPERSTDIDGVRLAVVAAIIATAVAANSVASAWARDLLDTVPVVGLAAAAVVLATAAIRRPDWSVVPEAAKGALFLLALVAAASLMPVERMGQPTLGTTFGIGVASAVFDNIPLTALALRQGGYEWALLAFAVGYGGSMVWFGSSAGVAICGLYPDARSARRWVMAGWHVPLAYLAGFATLAIARGWQPG